MVRLLGFHFRIGSIGISTQIKIYAEIPYSVREANAGLVFASSAQVAISKMTEITQTTPNALCVSWLLVCINTCVYGKNIPSQKSMLKYLRCFTSRDFFAERQKSDTTRTEFTVESQGEKIVEVGALRVVVCSDWVGSDVWVSG